MKGRELLGGGSAHEIGSAMRPVCGASRSATMVEPPELTLALTPRRTGTYLLRGEVSRMRGLVS